jgi:hypothetical protein
MDAEKVINLLCDVLYNNFTREVVGRESLKFKDADKTIEGEIKLSGVARARIASLLTTFCRLMHVRMALVVNGEYHKPGEQAWVGNANMSRLDLYDAARMLQPMLIVNEQCFTGETSRYTLLCAEKRNAKTMAHLLTHLMGRAPKLYNANDMLYVLNQKYDEIKGKNQMIEVWAVLDFNTTIIHVMFNDTGERDGNLLPIKQLADPTPADPGQCPNLELPQPLLTKEGQPTILEAVKAVPPIADPGPPWSTPESRRNWDAMQNYAKSVAAGMHTGNILHEASQSVAPLEQLTGRKHNHYFKDVSHLQYIDVYRVLQLFNVTDPCIQHAVKKLLVAGGRGAGKDISRDVQEAIDTMVRWQEMRTEQADEE